MNNLSVVLARFSKRSGRVVWGIVLLLCVVSMLSVALHGFNTNLISLIPARAEKTRLYLNLIRDFGIMDETYIVLDGDVMNHRPEIDAFARELSESGLVKDVTYRLDPGVMRVMAQMFRKNALLYLSGEELDGALSRLSPQGMERQLKKVRDRLVLPSSMLSLSDPLGFSEFLLPHLPSFDMPVDRSNGYFLTDNGRRLYLIVKPAGEARDIAFDRKLVELISRAFALHFSGGAVRMGITGNHPITYYEQAIMKRDMQWNIVTSLISVGVILLLFLRTPRGMVYAFIPVILSVVITMGLGVSVFGEMSEISGAFGAMLVGLGVDLTIVLYIRFLLDHNMEKSVMDTSGAIWGGVLTTAATFYPMVYSSFRGIKEFGFLTATGIIMCGLLVFSLSARIGKGNASLVPRHTGIESLPAFSLRHRKFVVIFSIALFALSLYWFRTLTVTADLREMGSRENPARRLFAELGIEKAGVFITGTAATREEVVNWSLATAHGLSRQGIGGTVSLASFIPGKERQMENIRELGSVDIDRVIGQFRSLAARQGFSKDRIETMAGNVRGFLDVKRPVTFEDLSKAGMDAFLSRFYRKEGNGYRYLVIAHAGGDLSVLPAGQHMTGVHAIKEELSSLLRRDSTVITIIGLVAVNIILLIKFRDPLYALYAQIPVTLAILCTGALFALLGISIHIMNAIVAIMLFGIGTDYSIHLIHAIRRGTDLSLLTRGMGRAITLAAFTTMAGFGSLFFSSYQGLSEMGMAVSIGCFLTLMFTLVLIPVLMRKHLVLNKA